MADVLMAWGPFLFQIGQAAYEELTHETGARWEKHQIIGRRPAAQYLGPDEEVVTVRGTAYPGVSLSAQATAQGLLAAAQLNQAYTLMTADGSVAGIFRLERASVVSSEILVGGAQKLTYDFEFHVHDDGTGSPWSAWP